jgi:rod shape-determining protein MreC
MRNIFLFIRRYFVLLSFLALQAFALWMLFHYNRFHRAVGLGIASELTGSVNTQIDKVDDYFHLREENRRVHQVNDSLINLMQENFLQVDTSARAFADTLLLADSTRDVRRYLWRPAKVVYNSVNFEKNYLQINRGSKEGIRENMAVLNSDRSLAGIVVAVSPNFSQVMSLLHVQSRVPASLKNNNVFGTIEWNGEDPRFLLLKGISMDVKVKQGDSVLTSIYSYNYPPGFLVGRIADIKTDKASGFYILKVRSAVNFNAVQQVFVVENLQRTEQLMLDEATKQKMEQKK